jgi:hypothetical protein
MFYKSRIFTEGYRQMISANIQRLAEQLQKNNPAFETFNAKLFCLEDAELLRQAMEHNTQVRFAIIEVFPESMRYSQLVGLAKEIQEIIHNNDRAHRDAASVFFKSN